MPNPAPRRNVATFYLVAAGIALLALVFGLWDLLVERDGGEDLVMQVLLPVLLLVLVLGLYRKARRDGARY